MHSCLCVVCVSCVCVWVGAGLGAYMLASSRPSCCIPMWISIPLEGSGVKGQEERMNLDAAASHGSSYTHIYIYMCVYVHVWECV